MPEYEFSMTRFFPYKNKLFEENPYSFIFYAVLLETAVVKSISVLYEVDGNYHNKGNS